jgi:hypothetical protein
VLGFTGRSGTAACRAASDTAATARHTIGRSDAPPERGTDHSELRRCTNADHCQSAVATQAIGASLDELLGTSTSTPAIPEPAASTPAPEECTLLSPLACTIVSESLFRQGERLIHAASSQKPAERSSLPARSPKSPRAVTFSPAESSATYFSPAAPARALQFGSAPAPSSTLRSPSTSRRSLATPTASPLLALSPSEELPPPMEVRIDANTLLSSSAFD